MPYQPGSQIGPYKIEEPLGRGAMGEVWAARDPRVDRRVAIKVLPEELAQDAERVARFEREAKALATLQHPNVASLYGFEEAELEGTPIRFLVMELAEGETLAERIHRGPLELDEAVEVFSQIADGLAAAHERGLVHRDLKPANVKITPEGQIKVLDFGLAKAVTTDTSVSPGLAESPTLTANATAVGVLLGTAAYMSPEQVRARPVDRRADVWAWGCCLYEALAGRRAFRGDDVTEVLASVLRDQPDWSSLPSTLPPGVVKLLERTLQKDPNRRWRDLGDARFALDQAIGDAPTPADDRLAEETRPGAWGRMAGAAALGAALTMLAVFWPFWGNNDSNRPVEHLAIPLDEPLAPIGLAFSPDGQTLAYDTEPSVSSSVIHTRRLGEPTAVEIPNSTDGRFPSFSPDGSRIAFVARNRLLIAPLGGDAPGVEAFELSKVGIARRYLWRRDGLIAYKSSPLELQLADLAKGTNRLLARSEVPFGPEDELPNGAFLAEQVGRIARFDDSGNSEVLIEGAIGPRVTPRGRILYLDRGQPKAVVYHAASGRIRGAPVALPLRVYHRYEQVAWAVSQTGDLAYVEASEAGSLWIRGPSGRREIGLKDSEISSLILSPDARFLAATPATGQDLTEGLGIVVYDLERSTRDPIRGKGWPSLWDPQGERLFVALRGRGAQGSGIAVVTPGGSEDQQVLLELPVGLAVPFGMDEQGRLYYYVRDNQEIDDGIYRMDLESRSSEKLIEGPFRNLRLSPDGGWFASIGNEEDETLAMVMRLDGSQRRSVSSSAANHVKWTRDRLYWLDAERQILHAARYRETPQGLEFDEPVIVAEGGFTNALLPSFDVSADGEMIVSTPQPRVEHIKIIRNVDRYLDELFGER